MDVRFDDDKLQQLERDPGFTGGFSPSIVKVFRKRMQAIRAAPDERDFYAHKSLHFERLLSDPTKHSMRLNNQYRLIVEIQRESDSKTVVVVGIEDYH